MPAWENQDGSTNTGGFISAYRKDDNVFWRADIGHIMNVLDDCIGALEDIATWSYGGNQVVPGRTYERIYDRARRVIHEADRE